MTRAVGDLCDALAVFGIRLTSQCQKAVVRGIYACCCNGIDVRSRERRVVRNTGLLLIEFLLQDELLAVVGGG